MSYLFRYFFDPGSGVCLWAANAAAKARFDYPVEHRALPLSTNTQYFLQHLIAWFDTSIDWSSPGQNDDCWPAAERARFHAAAAEGLRRLRAELATQGYVFQDEVRSTDKST